MNEAKLKELIADKEFIAKIMSMETAEEVCAAFGAEGIELSVSDIAQYKDMLEKHTSENSELSEDDLESVAGGGLLTTGAEMFIAGFEQMNDWTRNRW